MILFKLSIDFSELSRIRNINLVPFGQSMIVNGSVDYKEIIYNVLVFIPLGVYVRIFKPDWSWIKRILPAVILSLAFETIQYTFAIGASDITDVIANTLGGVVGALLYLLLRKVFKSRYITVTNIIGAVIEAVAVGLFVILTIANQ